MSIRVLCFRNPGRRPERGSALVFSMIILVALTLLGITAAATSTPGLRMAANAEDEMNVFQTAQAVIDNILSNPTVLPTVGALDTPSAPLPLTNVTTAFYVTAGETIQGTATRTTDCGLPPRLKNASSLNNFSTMGYRVDSSVNRLATGHGQSSLSQGFLTLIRKC